MLIAAVAPARLTLAQRAIVRADLDLSALIVGPAGSGKTQVLIHRVCHAIKSGIPAERIAIFSHGRLHAQNLVDAGTTVGAPVTAQTFDSWCSQYRAAIIKVPMPKAKGVPDFAAQQQMVLEHVSRNEPRPFDIVFVDEGQDLSITAYKILEKIGTSVTVFADDMQAIYAGGASLAEIAQCLGLNGPTHQLDDAYRCSRTIIAMAASFLPDHTRQKQLVHQAKTEDGETPSLVLCSDNAGELSAVATAVRIRCDLRESVAVLLPTKAAVERWNEWLTADGVPVAKKSPDGTSVSGIQILTYQSCKGLTFDAVFLPELTSQAFSTLPRDVIKRRLFVAVTRARTWLHLSAVDSALVEPVSQWPWNPPSFVKVRRPSPSMGRLEARTNAVIPEDDDPFAGLA